MKPNEWTVMCFRDARKPRPDLKRFRLNASQVAERIDRKLDEAMREVCQELGIRRPQAWLSGGRYRR